ncbi:MAG: LD-carboxypeptidase [Deltaproteobacteria bacterium]|jgi:muramoyltetrapeptide carboxypeptidase|nr:LD-carboxypeptidase [Deltaproteobacteria bacterium]
MKKTNKRKSSHITKPHPVIPPPINKGETIGLVAPAGSLANRKNFNAGVKLLEERGFRVKFNRRLLDRKGYLAGSDRERADEFNKMWADPEVKALVAVRGGYGCLRMLDMIDMKKVRSTPKILIGFSDLTVLLNAIHKKTGLVTFHGPVVTSLATIDRKSQKSFFNTLLGKTPKQILPSGIKVLHEGKAKGVLLGGNLTTLVHLIGTPHEISWQDTILFIEDIGEKPYSLDRLLTHLSKAGRLQKIKGLILGSFTDEERKERAILQKTVQSRIKELLEAKKIPVWANFPTGHSRRNLTLPVGVQAELDTSTNILTLS